ncbi:hypothetical protein C7534_1371, partial [Pseudomonas sp. OV226]
MPTSSPHIAVLGSFTSGLGSIELERFADLDSLLAVPAFDVLLLDMPGASAGKLLRKLRIDTSYRFSLIYCCRDLDGWC